MHIMYCIAGEGRGHACRTIPIYEHLIAQGHTVDLFAGGASLPLLKKYHPTKISSLRLSYKNNHVKDLSSVVENAWHFREHLQTLRTMHEYIQKKKPDVLINDFETFSNYVAHHSAIPILTVDNENIITSTTCVVPKRFQFNATKVHWVVRLLSPFATKRLIPTFFYPKKHDPAAELLPPVVRDEILELKPKTGEHVLVYQTSKSNTQLIKTLHSIPSVQFRVHGFGINKHNKNVTFLSNNHERFLRDLETCSGIIMNGGFTLMTEALALKKPILSLPILGQFEQVLNGHYLEKQKLGLCSFSTSAAVVKKFIETKEHLRQKIKKHPKHSNKPFFDALNHALKEVLS